MNKVDRVIVHIGSDKAGSTAIQESLFANHTWYAEQGIHVPVTGLARAAGHPHLFNAVADPEMVEALADEAVEAPTVLLSWEGVHFFDKAKQRDLRRALDRAYPGASVTFVYYVRNQIDLIQSGVLQQIKQQAIEPVAVADLNRPLDDIPKRSRRFLFPKTRYFHERLEDWKQIFPDADFVVRLYDRERLLNGDILDDFHEVLGLPAHGRFLRPVAMTNTSLTAEAAVVLDRVSRLVWNEEDRRRVIDVLLSFGDGSGNYLFQDTRDAIAERYAEDNDRLIAAHPDCAGVERSRSRAREVIDPDTVRACEQFLIDQGEYPTLLQGKVGRRDLGLLNLHEGWDTPNEHGVWGVGTRSVLRFRPRSMHFTGFSDGVEIVFDAQYPGRRAVTDDVIVNGRSLGPVDLTNGVVHVPLDDLDRTYDIEIVLEHSGRPRRKGPADPGKDRSVLLHSLAYAVR